MRIANQFDIDEWDEIDLECKCEIRYQDCAAWCIACQGYTGKCNVCKKKFVCIARIEGHTCQPKELKSIKDPKETKDWKWTKGEMNGKN